MQRPRDAAGGNAEFGVRNAEWKKGKGQRGKVRDQLRTPHSELRTFPPRFRIPNSAFRICLVPPGGRSAASGGCLIAPGGQRRASSQCFAASSEPPSVFRGALSAFSERLTRLREPFPAFSECFAVTSELLTAFRELLRASSKRFAVSSEPFTAFSERFTAFSERFPELRELFRETPITVAMRRKPLAQYR